MKYVGKFQTLSQARAALSRPFIAKYGNGEINFSEERYNPFINITVGGSYGWIFINDEDNSIGSNMVDPYSEYFKVVYVPEEVKTFALSSNHSRWYFPETTITLNSYGSNVNEWNEGFPNDIVDMKFDDETNTLYLSSGKFIDYSNFPQYVKDVYDPIHSSEDKSLFNTWKIYYDSELEEFIIDLATSLCIETENRFADIVIGGNSYVQYIPSEVLDFLDNYSAGTWNGVESNLQTPFEIDTTSITGYSNMNYVIRSVSFSSGILALLGDDDVLGNGIIGETINIQIDTTDWSMSYSTETSYNTESSFSSSSFFEE